MIAQATIKPELTKVFNKNAVPVKSALKTSTTTSPSALVGLN